MYIKPLAQCLAHEGTLIIIIIMKPFSPLVKYDIVCWKNQDLLLVTLLDLDNIPFWLKVQMWDFRIIT